MRARMVVTAVLIAAALPGCSARQATYATLGGAAGAAGGAAFGLLAGDPLTGAAIGGAVGAGLGWNKAAKEDALDDPYAHCQIYMRESTEGAPVYDRECAAESRQKLGEMGPLPRPAPEDMVGTRVRPLFPGEVVAVPSVSSSPTYRDYGYESHKRGYYGHDRWNRRYHYERHGYSPHRRFGPSYQPRGGYRHSYHKGAPVIYVEEPCKLAGAKTWMQEIAPGEYAVVNAGCELVPNDDGTWTAVPLTS
jgi:hypothetical protein